MLIVMTSARLESTGNNFKSIFLFQKKKKCEIPAGFLLNDIYFLKTLTSNLKSANDLKWVIHHAKRKLKLPLSEKRQNEADFRPQRKYFVFVGRSRPRT